MKNASRGSVLYRLLLFTRPSRWFTPVPRAPGTRPLQTQRMPNSNRRTRRLGRQSPSTGTFTSRSCGSFPGVYGDQHRERQPIFRRRSLALRTCSLMAACQKIRRVEYDIEREVYAMTERGLPHADWVARTLRSARPQVPPESRSAAAQAWPALASRYAPMVFSASFSFAGIPTTRRWYAVCSDSVRIEGACCEDSGWSVDLRQMAQRLRQIA